MRGKTTAHGAVRRCACVTALAWCAAVTPAAAGGGYAITRSVVASGGGVVSASCYALVSTLGQAAAGSSVAKGSGKQYRLDAGFLAAQGPLGERLFHNGFEPNTGDCTP